jgi:hypothetical protein
VDRKEEEELKKWVREMLEEGHEPKKIKDSLRDAGLDPGAVDRAQKTNKQTETENNSGNDSEAAQETRPSPESQSVSNTDNEENSDKPEPHTQKQKQEEAGRGKSSSSYLDRRTATIVAGITALVLVSVAFVVMAPSDVLTDQSSAEKPNPRTTEPVGADGTDASGLSAEPEGLRVNISQSGVQPVNPSTDLTTISFVNKLDQPVEVYLSPGDRSKRISPRRHIQANTSSVNYFTVTMPDGYNVTGSLQQ